MLDELNSLKFPVDLRIVFDKVELHYNFGDLTVCFHCGDVGHAEPTCHLKKNAPLFMLNSKNKIETSNFVRARKWYWLLKTEPEKEITLLVQDLTNLYNNLKSKKIENLPLSERKLAQKVNSVDEFLVPCSSAVADTYGYVNYKVHVHENVVKKIKTLNIFGMPGDMIFSYFIQDLSRTVDPNLPPMVYESEIVG